MRCGGPSAVRTRTAAKRASSFPLVPFRRLRVIRRAQSRDEKFVITTLETRAWPKEASAIEQRYREIQTVAQSRIDVASQATYEISEALQQRSMVLAAYRTLLDDKLTSPNRWNRAIGYLKRAGDFPTVDSVNARINDALETANVRRQSPIQQDVIARHQLASELNKIATVQMAIATSYARQDVRYSSDQERLSARVAFEEGSYAEALRRYFAPDLPVSLWLPNLTWQVLEGDFKGIPEQIRGTVSGDGLLISARTGDVWADVLRMKGGEMDALQRLSDTLIKATDAGRRQIWSDGELLSDQILTTQIPVRAELASAARAMRPESGSAPG